MKNPFWLLVSLLFLLPACSNVSEDSAEDADSEDEEKEIVYDIPKGFELEELYHPKGSSHGSWVALAEGENGLFYASDQWGDLYQFQIPEVGATLDSTMVDSVDLEIGRAHGLLWAFNSLYVSVNAKWEDDDGEQLRENGSGVYRLRDTDGDGKLDSLNLLLKLEGDGEHGPHSLVLSPSGEEIYFIAGNHTLVPEMLTKNSRLPDTWDEDNLFPPYLDARGHANDIKAPGGWIAKTDPEGEDWELISAGFRNPFDMGFNQDGELFAFDADMEWDIGMPWYRPIRVCHVTSGSEFGWRTGSGKWPAYYTDNLSAVINLGQGSPTAVVMGKDLDFPAQYKTGMFVFDWSFGTTYYVELDAAGSTYQGEKQEFFSGTPLPLTDAIAGRDGALYFATGGRKLDSRFYRLRYTGGEEGVAGKLTTGGQSEQLRALRKQLESFHNTDQSVDLNLIWENLNHEDRFIKYAARIALEHQPTNQWKSKMSTETDADRIIQSTIALARSGKNNDKSTTLSKLSALSWSELDKSQQLDLLRAYGLVGMRLNGFTSAEAKSIAAKLTDQFPSGDYALDRELAQLLVYLKDAPTTGKAIALLEKHTTEKTITHPTMLTEEVTTRSEDYGPLILDVLKNMPPTEALYYGTLLSHATAGWDKGLREKYFNWFYDGLNAKGGRSFKPFFENIRKVAISKVPEEERAYFEELSGVYQPGEELANVPQPIGPGGEYNAHDIGGIVGRGLKDYKGDIAKGKLVYQAALCASCHRMRGEGGVIGHDLTQLHTRYKRGEIISAIFSPNDEISDQYAFTLFHLKDGKKVAGKVLSEKDGKIVLAPNVYSSAYTVELAESEVTKRELSPISPMPSNLLNRLNEEEITDLFAYLMSGGDEEHHYYGGTKGLEEEKGK